MKPISLQAGYTARSFSGAVYSAIQHVAQDKWQGVLVRRSYIQPRPDIHDYRPLGQVFTFHRGAIDLAASPTLFAWSELAERAATRGTNFLEE